jgi:hypothetical protein
MTAPNDRPGAFLLEVAEIGLQLNKSFTTFISYRKVQDRRLENLYATLNITTGCLTDLGTTLNKHEDSFRMEVDVTRAVAEKCKSNFETLKTMVGEGISEGGVWKGDGTIGGQTVTTEIDPWLLITMAVGGRDAAKDFWTCLDETRDALVELNHIVTYMILKSMEEKYVQEMGIRDHYTNNTCRAMLKPDDESQLQKLKTLLPHIVQSRETQEKAKKEEAEFAAAVEAGRKEREERVKLTRVDSVANSDITLLPSERRRCPPPVVVEKVRDFDNRSVSSWCSSSADSVVDVDVPEEIYEEWILRWNPPVKNVNRSWGFLGLKFKNYYEDFGFWGTDPEFRTLEEMKEQEKFASADKSPAKHKEAICKVLQALPKKGGIAIDHLLEERTESSSHEEAKREWSVVAVRPKQKYPYGSNKKWGKDPNYTDWLVTIKAVTIDTQDRSRSYRRDDPFRKRRSRDYSPVSRRYHRSPSPRPIRRRGPHNRIIDIDVRRDMPPLRPLPLMRNPVRTPMPARDRGDVYVEDGYVQGKVVVGKIMTKKEAEEKIVGVWEDMVAKASEPAPVPAGESVDETEVKTA